MKVCFALAALALIATSPAVAATLVAESGTPVPALSAFRAAGSKTLGSGFIVKNLPAPIAVPNAVPEPETWAMLLMGFGVVGALGRRRPRLRSVAA